MSESVYLDDPEGNGIEVYADRAPEQWKWEAGSVAMATDGSSASLLATTSASAPLSAALAASPGRSTSKQISTPTVQPPSFIVEALSATTTGAPTYTGPLDATVPLAELRGIPHVTRVELTESHELIRHLERSPQAAGPEEIIGQALWVLLNHQIRIRGVSLGKGLERRVMDLV